MQRKRLFKFAIMFVSLGLGVALFVWLLAKEGGVAILDNLVSFGFLPFIGFVTISSLNFTLYAWRWQLIINSHLPPRERLPLRRVYLHRMAGFAMSYLTPAAQVGGEPARIAMLGSDNVPLRHATSSVILDVAFEMTAYIAFIVSGVVLAIAQGLGDGVSFAIVLIALGLTLVLLILFFWGAGSGRQFFSLAFRAVRLDRVARLKRFVEPIRSMETLMTEFLQGKISLVILVAFLSIVVIFFRVVEVFYLALFFGVDVSLAQAFLVSTIPGIALLLPVPAGLGVFEGSFELIFTLLAIPMSPVAFALIIRSRDLIFIFVGVMHMAQRGRAFLEARLLGKGA